MTDFKKILVPVDFSEHSVNILNSARAIAQKFTAAVEVVFVVEGLAPYAGFVVPHISLDNMEKDLITRAEGKMDDFMEENGDTSVPHSSKVLNGKIAEQIVLYCEKAGCDLIVIGTHACKGLEKTLFGSVTERVLKTAPCPVLTLNPCK